MKKTVLSKRSYNIKLLKITILHPLKTSLSPPHGRWWMGYSLFWFSGLAWSIYERTVALVFQVKICSLQSIIIKTKTMKVIFWIPRVLKNCILYRPYYYSSDFDTCFLNTRGLLKKNPTQGYTTWLGIIIHHSIRSHCES